jgi:GDPmannose 4,6-dehydratase
VKALITGVTGQDGAYLSELLLAKGYEVHGLLRRSSSNNTDRIEHLHPAIVRHFGDVTDGSGLLRILAAIRPDEVYNLAAMSHVAVSFDTPEYTANADALGPLRLLEAIRALGLGARFYQASTSELFGLARQTPQNEETPFHPRSPYAVAKLYAHWITVNYREAYGIFACNGILFNHESPRRGEAFVSRKITRGIARIAVGTQRELALGNLDARRDWGHARDYVEMAWKMLQQPAPDDYVIASGVQRGVRDLVTAAAAVVGIEVVFSGTGPAEIGTVADPGATACRAGDVIVRVDPALYRPADVDALVGDASKARDQLGWTPKTSFEDLVREMVEADLAAARRA